MFFPLQLTKTQHLRLEYKTNNKTFLTQKGGVSKKYVSYLKVIIKIISCNLTNKTNKYVYSDLFNITVNISISRLIKKEIKTIHLLTFTFLSPYVWLEYQKPNKTQHTQQRINLWHQSGKFKCKKKSTKTLASRWMNCCKFFCKCFSILFVCFFALYLSFAIPS